MIHVVYSYIGRGAGNPVQPNNVTYKIQHVTNDDIMNYDDDRVASHADVNGFFGNHWPTQLFSYGCGIRIYVRVCLYTVCIVYVRACVFMYVLIRK